MSSNEKDRIFVDADDRITSSENNLVDLKLSDGRVFEKLEPRRLFPVSRASTYITMLDSEGVEVAMIRSIDALEQISRAVIQDSLNDYYLVPEITKIISVTEKYGTLH